MYSKMFGFSRSSLGKFTNKLVNKNTLNYTKFNNFCVLSNRKPEAKASHFNNDRK